MRTLILAVLGLAVMLLAGVVTRADGPDRSFADIVSQVDEAPTGRFMLGVRATSHSTPAPEIERRLKGIERKLDRILKELESLKGQQKTDGLETPNCFNFTLGAFY